MPISGGPHYTQFPDELLDVWMARLSGPEWKVLCYIVRHTFGWKKDVDAISFEQFLRGVVRRDGEHVDYGTGLGSRVTLARALDALEEKQLIRRVVSRSKRGTQEVNAYEVWVEEPAARASQSAAVGASLPHLAVVEPQPSTGNGLGQAPSRVQEMDSASRVQEMDSALRVSRVHSVHLSRVQEMDSQETTTLQETTNQETTSCAPNGTPPVPPAASSAHVTSNGKATKRRERKMSDREKADVEAAITHFNVRLRPVVDDEYGRFIRESLAGIRGFGLNHFCRTIDFMATNPRFVSDPYVTPLTVTKTVPIWEDNGQPTRWQQLDDRKKRLALKGRS